MVVFVNNSLGIVDFNLIAYSREMIGNERNDKKKLKLNRSWAIKVHSQRLIFPRLE